MFLRSRRRLLAMGASVPGQQLAHLLLCVANDTDAGMAGGVDSRLRKLHWRCLWRLGCCGEQMLRMGHG